MFLREPHIDVLGVTHIPFNDVVVVVSARGINRLVFALIVLVPFVLFFNRGDFVFMVFLHVTRNV